MFTKSSKVLGYRAILYTLLHDIILKLLTCPLESVGMGKLFLQEQPAPSPISVV